MREERGQAVVLHLAGQPQLPAASAAPPGLSLGDRAGRAGKWEAQAVMAGAEALEGAVEWLALEEKQAQLGVAVALQAVVVARVAPVVERTTVFRGSRVQAAALIVEG
jgi:hypothetical protein